MYSGDEQYDDEITSEMEQVPMVRCGFCGTLHAAPECKLSTEPEDADIDF